MTTEKQKELTDLIEDNLNVGVDIVSVPVQDIVAWIEAYKNEELEKAIEDAYNAGLKRGINYNHWYATSFRGTEGITNGKADELSDLRQLKIKYTKTNGGEGGS